MTARSETGSRNSDTFTVTIDSLSYGGRGVGRRQDGKVAFIPYVIPGETVLAQVDKEHSSYCIASPLEIREGSEKRISPQCPLFTRCGGCDWQHISYDEQLKWKSIILGHEAERSAPLQGVVIHEPVPSDQIYAYRGHTVLQCQGGNIGFFMKKTNRIIPVEECPVLNPRLQEIVRGLGRVMKKMHLDELQSLELHAPQEEAILEVSCGRADERSARRIMEGLLHELGLSGVSLVTPGWRQLLGGESCSYALLVNGREVRISSSFGEFIQANRQVNQSMVDHVVGLASGSRRVVDLYCGSGNFSIPLALVSERVLAVEWSKGLVSQGVANASRNGTGNVEFKTQDVTKALEGLQGDLSEGDTVVLDPPREGAKDAAPMIPGLGASRVIYISCNPTTMARDLKPLIAGGYVLKGLRLFDMFPQTFHIEAVALLEKGQE